MVLPETGLPHAVAHAVLSRFDALPQKRKPSIRDNGCHDWVPLSGIVAEIDGRMICLALATGMKCLPSAKLPLSRGIGIHDWHAEILAIRTFNRFLLDECRSMLAGGDDHGVLVKRPDSEAGSSRPFEIRDGIKFHMYCSEAPCGDASMELIMSAQEDASPWDTPSQEAQTLHNGDLPGRAYFSQLGVVRRKPSRGDAPLALSKSCSDKLALKQCTSLLSSITSMFIHPANAYIHTLVLPELQYSQTACQRAFSESGRMLPVTEKSWGEGYAFHPFLIQPTTKEFRYSKRVLSETFSNLAASNLAAAWSLSGVDEGIIGGVLQGRKQFDGKGASKMSRMRMWLLAQDLSIMIPGSAVLEDHFKARMYEQVKVGPLLTSRRIVKDDVHSMALPGWARNEGDSDFSVNCLG
ncbi:hypothetical protein S40288_03465 [Stachybotrys chartarum IBT 40288]|nr:hypothetical protein S40288_03465 [Stachybotrys chartarum IBT 40288]